VLATACRLFEQRKIPFLTLPLWAFKSTEKKNTISNPHHHWHQLLLANSLICATRHTRTQEKLQSKEVELTLALLKQAKRFLVSNHMHADTLRSSTLAKQARSSSALYLTWTALVPERNSTRTPFSSRTLPTRRQIWLNPKTKQQQHKIFLQSKQLTHATAIAKAPESKSTTNQTQ
jgi:hypothetical protein